MRKIREFAILLNTKLLHTFAVSEAPPQHVLERQVPGNEDLAALQFAELNSILADALTKHKKQL
jgi:hypothetical protein